MSYTKIIKLPNKTRVGSEKIREVMMIDVVESAMSIMGLIGALNLDEHHFGRHYAFITF